MCVVKNDCKWEARVQAWMGRLYRYRIDHLGECTLAEKEALTLFNEALSWIEAQEAGEEMAKTNGPD